MGLKKSLLAKRIKKFRNRALNNWAQTIKEYDLRVDVNAFYSEANDYGYVMAQRGLWGAIVSILTNPVNLIIAAVYIVSSFIPGVNIFSTASAASWIGSLIGTTSTAAIAAIQTGLTVLNISTMAISQASQAINNQKLLNAHIGSYGEIGKASLIDSVESAEMQKAKSDTLTNTLIYAPYEIYPKGAIYNDNQLGGQNTNFRYTEPYDAMKGINADFKPQNEAEEMSYNRYQKKDAGNIAYMSETLKQDVPLPSSLDNQRQGMIIDECYNARVIKTSKGFQKMLEQGYGMGVGDPNTFTNTWKMLDKATIKPFQSNKCQLDFLEKNRAYQKGLLRDFFTQELYHFITPEVKKPYDDEEVYLTMYKDLKELLSLDITDDEKAMFYVDALSRVFEAVFLGEEVYTVEIANEKRSMLNYAFYNGNPLLKSFTLGVNTYSDFYASQYSPCINNFFYATKISFDEIKEKELLSYIPNVSALISFVKSCVGKKPKARVYYDVVKTGNPIFGTFPVKSKRLENVEVDIFKATKIANIHADGLDSYTYNVLDTKAFQNPKLFYLNGKEHLSELKDESIIKFLQDCEKEGFLELTYKDEAHKEENLKLLEKYFKDYVVSLFEEEEV